MNRQSNAILQLHLKKVVLLVVSVVLLLFCVFSILTFIEKVNYLWEKEYQIKYMELLMLAKHRLEDAEFEKEWACNSVSLLKPVGAEESEECKRAKEEYQKALEYYNQVMAKKDEILSVEENVKSYFVTIAKAVKECFFLVLFIIISMGISIASIYILTKNIRKTKIDV